MRAREIMTTQIVTVGPDTPVREVAAVLLEHHISGVPVVDSDAHVVGIIGESDLIHRIAAHGAHSRSWWQALVAGPRTDPADFIKVHGMRAQDVMTRAIVTVSEETSVEEIAQKLEEHRVRRVVVLREGKLIGIVSRADLLRIVVGLGPEPQQVGWVEDDQLRERVLSALKAAEMGRHLNVSARVGIVELTGLVSSESERKALCLAAEEVPGVRQVEDHLTMIRRRI
jgi:CBS-domain-containing membrane protein